MFKSLRSRILISHFAVIVLVFSLTFLIAFIPIRNAQTRLEVQRLEDVAAPVAVQAGFVLGRPALSGAAGEILDAQARQLDVRLVLLDRFGNVIHDTQPSESLAPQITRRLNTAITTLDQRAGQAGAIARLGTADRSYYIGTVGGDRVVLTLLPQADGRYIAILAPKNAAVLQGLFIPLLLALGIGLLGAFFATLFLSRSIALPITRLTEAADAVANGDLNRNVPDQGDDEVGRLIKSFNEMVDRLRVTYESQRRLLANVAHEIRTPLTSIQGYAHGLSDGVFVTEEQRLDALTTIGEESERVNELLVQILELARLESGQSGPQIRDVELEDVIERVLRRHRIDAQNSGIELAVSTPGSRTILADEGLIDQAIDNLVRNAIRHTPAGGRVEVSVVAAAQTSSAQPGMRIRVSDTGAGIPPEALPHIFDRFYRVDDANDNGRGFGLGLAIVREIVLAHGGSVGVESELGHGTAFIIDLPDAFVLSDDADQLADPDELNTRADTKMSYRS